MGKKRPNKKHRTRRNQGCTSSCRPAAASTETQQAVLIPTPLVLSPMPDPARLADDGTLALSLAPGNVGGGWHLFAVYAADGLLQGMLVFTRQELTVDDLLVLDRFERQCWSVGDPAYRDYDPRERFREAASAPGGPENVIAIECDHDAPSADGTRTVIISAQGELESWVVLDTDGLVIDGARFPEEGDAPEVDTRFGELLTRRLDAGDPRVKAKKFTDQDVDADTSGPGGER